MAVFYSFHYERDVNRVQLIRNMGKIEGQPLLNAQEWERVRAQGASAVKRWIDEQMKYKSVVIVLIGRETESRSWVQYEIQKAWDDKKPLLGIRIHGLSSMGASDVAGPDPFTHISGFEGKNPGIEIFDPTIRDIYGRIDTKATYQNLATKLPVWSALGITRKS